MTTLGTLKKLLLGETWIVPVGVAATLALGLVPPASPAAAAPLVALGVLAVLLASVGRGARRR